MKTTFAVCLLAALACADLVAQRRVVVRKRAHPRTRVVVHTGHPIRRPLPVAVVVRPARTRVVVGAPLVFLPVVAFTVAAITLPARDRLVWQDTEVIEKDDDWVDSNFGVDSRGDALVLAVEGRAQLNFAEVTFNNGNVQVV
ncbi:MAG: hypothetical protein ACRD96_11475, partial [Bryobacteraceae bacterium]